MRPSGHVSRPLQLPYRVGIQAGGLRLRAGGLNHHHEKGRRRALHIKPLLEASVHATHDLITGVHAAIDAPWFVTIPLFAVTLNVLLRLPFAVYGQRIARQRVKLTPLLQAWYNRHAREILEKSTSGNRSLKTVEKAYLKSAKRLYRDWGVQTWKSFTGFLSLPFFLISVETIKRMSGGPPGLIGFLYRRPGSDESNAESPVAGGSMAPLDVKFTNNELPATSTEVVDSLAEPSFATGGCLWFPDLTLPDPYHVLPFALSALLLTSILTSPAVDVRALLGVKAGPASTRGMARPVVGKYQIFMQRSLLVFACSAGLTTMHLPSAIHIYWLSSSAAGLFVHRIVRQLMPVSKPEVEPCKGREGIFLRPPRPHDENQRQ